MKTVLILGVLLFLSSCEESDSGAFAGDAVKLKVFLRSAPGDQQDIIFRMKHFEILYEESGEPGAVITGKKIKELSLLELKHKVPLSMEPVRLAAGAHLREVRLVLEEENHVLRRLDGSPCKLNLHNLEASIPAEVDAKKLESGVDYALVLELAADSIMLDLGTQGECTARPFFRVRALRPLDQRSGEESESEGPETEELPEEG